MAAQRASAALLATMALLASQLPGSLSKGQSLPKLPSNGICCEVASVVPQSLLRRDAKDFARAQNLCTRGQTSWEFTIFAGYDSPGAGGGGGGGGGGQGPAVFGCASATEPACVSRHLSVCSPACLRSKKCFLRFPTATPFLVDQEEARKTRTRTNVVVETSRTNSSSDVDKRDNGETVRTNVTEANRGRVNISSTENRRSRFRGVDINSKSLPIIGETLLRSGSGLRKKPPIRLGLIGERQPLSVFTEGSATAGQTGKGFCCRLNGVQAPQPLAGITSLIDSETQCRNKRLGLAVRISADRWGCGGDSFKAKCDQLKSCDGCLPDATCMTVYRVSLAISIEIVRNRLSGSTFDVSQAGRDTRKDTIRREIGGGGTLTGLRTLRNFTVEDTSGTRRSQQESRENRRTISEVGPGGEVRGGVVVEAAVTVTGSAATNRNVSQQTNDRGQTVVTRNLSQPGRQVGSSRQVATRDVTRNRNTALKKNETSKDVTRTSTASGNQRGELLPGLRSPRNGSASLSAGERNTSQLGQENVFTSTVERTTGNTNLRTADGSRQRTATVSAVLQTDAERTGARNDSNIKTTGFTTEDGQLGTVSLDRREVNSGSVMDRVTASGTRTGDSARTVTACARCNRTTDLTAQSRGDRQNQTTAHIETVKRDVTKTTSVDPGRPLPSLSVTARDIREAQTADSISRGAGNTRNVTSLRTRGTGFRSSRNRTILSVERNNNTDHVEEVKKVTVIKAVTT